MTAELRRHGGRAQLASIVAALVAASTLWVALWAVGRAQWFDLRCLDLAETSVAMRWVGWFPPHWACLDATGHVVARDHTETLWLLLLVGPLLILAVVVMAGLRRVRRRSDPWPH
jgi:hypothetical protein